MAQLRQDYTAFTERDGEVVVIGPEGKEAFASFWKDQDLPFVGLPDPAHSVLKSYGQKVNLFRLGRMPAQVLVDKKGMARYVHYGHDMRDIPENDRMLEILDDLQRE
jgi:peroxiredoxin